MKGAIGEKVSETEYAQKFYQSEEYKKIQDYRKEVNEFKSDLREHVDNSHNPVVQVANSAVDKIVNNSACAEAIIAMKRYDPDFDLEELSDEAMEIF